MKSLKVIVLVLSYNGKNLLDDCVTSYLANDYDNFEVVVIDNGSTDGTKEYVEKMWPTVPVLRSVFNLKYSGGCNIGLQYAFIEKQADYALITNNDVRADIHVISACVKTAELDPKISFVTGKVYYFEQPDTFQTVGKKFDSLRWNGGHIGRGEKDIGQYDKIEELYWCDDIFWLVNKDVYLKIGGYDPEFAFQSEDFDWQARAKIAGFKIFYTPDAKIWHKESMTIGKQSAFKAYYDARNPIIVHLKYRNPDEVRYEIKIRFKSLLKSTVKNLLKFRIYYIIKSWQGFFSALLWGVKNKKFTKNSL